MKYANGQKSPAYDSHMPGLIAGLSLRRDISECSRNQNESFGRGFWKVGSLLGIALLSEDAVSLTAENFPQQNCSAGRMFDVLATKHRFVAYPGHKSHTALLGAPPHAGISQP